MAIINNIPNPYNKNSTHADFEKKTKLTKEKFSFLFLGIKIIFLSALAGVLFLAFDIPKVVIFFLIGAEVLTTILSGFIKSKKIRDIKTVNIESKAKSYRSVLVKDAYWNFVTSIIGLIISVIGAGLLFVFFNSEISSFILDRVRPEIPINTVYLKGVFFIFSIAWFLYFLYQFLRHNWIKKISKNNDDFAEVNQEYLLVHEKINLIKVTLVLGLVTLFLYSIDAPDIVPLISAGITLLVILLSVVKIKRIGAVVFNNNETTDSHNSSFMEVDNNRLKSTSSEENLKGEKIEGVVFGIKRVGKGSGSFSFLGTGKEQSPENALLITNLRLLMIQIPVTGGDKVVGENPFVTKNFLFNRDEIREKGQQFLNENSLSETLKLAKEGVLYQDVKKVKLHKTKLTIEKVTGEKLSYFFMDREYISLLNNLLESHLEVKYIHK